MQKPVSPQAAPYSSLLTPTNSLLFAPPYPLLFSPPSSPPPSCLFPLCQVLHRRRHPERLAHPADRSLLPHGPGLPGKQVSAHETFYADFNILGNFLGSVLTFSNLKDKPAAQAAGADLSQCNSTNRLNPPLQ